jgi:hypothetical protein
MPMAAMPIMRRRKRISRKNYGELDGKMPPLRAPRVGLGRAYAKRLAGVGCEGRGG